MSHGGLLVSSVCLTSWSALHCSLEDLEIEVEGHLARQAVHICKLNQKIAQLHCMQVHVHDIATLTGQDCSMLQMAAQWSTCAPVYTAWLYRAHCTTATAGYAFFFCFTYACIACMRKFP